MCCFSLVSTTGKAYKNLCCFQIFRLNSWKKQTNKQQNGNILGTERTAHISHTFSLQWLMPLWKKAEMAVARIHGKVKCRRFKEKRRRAPFTKHGVTCSGLFVSCFIIFFVLFCLFLILYLYFSRLWYWGVMWDCQSKLLCSHSFHLETGWHGWH